jgi:hypothetical protein
MRAGRSAAPVMSSVRWLLVSMLAWELAAVVRPHGPATTGSWPINPFDLLVLVVMPSLTAFALVRLFLAAVQSGFGSLNTYTLTSSPWSWAFWLGLAVAMVGHGEHMGADILHRSLPAAVAHGEFAAQLQFFDVQLGHRLFGLGFFVTTAVLIIVGQGASRRVIGMERTLLLVGSLLTYGLTFMYLGVAGEQIVPAILGSGLLVGLSVWVLPPSEATHDPIWLLILPGTGLAGIILLAWGLLVGGQPTWPF